MKLVWDVLLAHCPGRAFVYDMEEVEDEEQAIALALKEVPDTGYRDPERLQNHIAIGTAISDITIVSKPTDQLGGNNG